MNCPAEAGGPRRRTGAGAAREHPRGREPGVRRARLRARPHRRRGRRGGHLQGAHLRALREQAGPLHRADEPGRDRAARGPRGGRLGGGHGGPLRMENAAAAGFQWVQEHPHAFHMFVRDVTDPEISDRQEALRRSAVTAMADVMEMEPPRPAPAWRGARPSRSPRWSWPASTRWPTGGCATGLAARGADALDAAASCGSAWGRCRTGRAGSSSSGGTSAGVRETPPVTAQAPLQGPRDRSGHRLDRLRGGRVAGAGAADRHRRCDLDRRRTPPSGGWPRSRTASVRGCWTSTSRTRWRSRRSTSAATCAARSRSARRAARCWRPPGARRALLLLHAAGREAGGVRERSGRQGAGPADGGGAARPRRSRRRPITPPTRSPWRFATRSSARREHGPGGEPRGGVRAQAQNANT